MWDWTMRSSPIFLLDGFDVPELSRKEPHLLFFVGPIDPGVIEIDVPTFCTLGTYNVIFAATRSLGHVDVVKSFLDAHPDVRWECWEVAENAVLQTTWGGGTQKLARAKIKRAHVASELMSAEEENCTLLAAATSKALQYFPEVASELTLFSAALRNKLEQINSETDNTKLSWLVNVNAHLSRFTSQAFSGVSPIASTESHFWSHSLLGIGMACQSLVNIRRFCEKAIGSSDWIDALDRLSLIRLPASWIHLMQRNPTVAAEWIDIEIIVNEAVQSENEAASGKASDLQERLPLIVCYSGRDGFRSTPFSLSAPMEVISGANAFGWSPMTLSHEICHVWMSGILGTIFPANGGAADIQQMSLLLNNEIQPANVLDDLRRYFYMSFVLLDREARNVPDEDTDDDSDPKNWIETVESNVLQVNETLTHILDYQFFYQQDESRYVRSIWSSWDVIPNIKDRLSSYLIRSACALLSERINHENPISASLDRLQALLEELRRDMGQSSYLDDALGILDRDRKNIETKMEHREHLVRMAKVFFANRPIAARLEREYQEPGGPYKSMSPLVLDYRQIWNPLRFVSQFSVDRKADRNKALWILAKIAFMQDPNETFA